MENGASPLFTKGLSTKIAIERLVKIGKSNVEDWDKQRVSTDYRCSIDKVLCRNLLWFTLVTAIFLFMGAVTTENHMSILSLGLTVLYIIFLLTSHFVQWWLYSTSISMKKQKALEALNCVAKISKTSFSYAPLGEPLSDVMTTQTTIRDGNMVAVPKILLVEGDIILLRPSQLTPCDCQLSNGEILRKGERILGELFVNHSAEEEMPLSAIKAVVLSTPLVEHLNAISVNQRSFSPMEYQLHYCIHVICEKIVLPIVFTVSVFLCLVRFFQDGSQSLFSTRFVFAIPSLITLPLVSPTFFFISLFSQQWGNIAVCDALRIPTVKSTKDFISLFGSLTGTSFFDKEGILAPMNPSLDKVAFFRTNVSEEVKDGLTLEIMDLSAEQSLGGSCNVGFDDPNWTQFYSNLRVIGQILSLNRCDSLFTTFLDHLSTVASSIPRTTASTCRRCSCLLPQLIGFRRNPNDTFSKPLQILGFYRSRPDVVSFSDFTLQQNALEMAYCTLHADDHSLYYHLSCQGTANLVLEACSHVWNGKTLLPITERAIKMATDFYQRHSVTGHCLVLSYRAIGTVSDDSLRCHYYEIPLLHSRPKMATLARTHSFDSSLDDPFFEGNFSQFGKEAAQRWFSGHALCGLIATQYEVMPQVVQLIDQLENLCVRFVYFSSENELRSRVFAEKLGLEAGWNCHVSLAEISNNADKETLKNLFYFKKCGNVSATNSDKIRMKSRSEQQLFSTDFTFRSQGFSLSRSQNQAYEVSAHPNKARLPTGISAIRPHLDHVDNVPLLVGLITDCTPSTSLQMLQIMQEYGEVVLAIGSSLSVANVAIFLQANLSISVLPLGDWQCIQQPAPNNWLEVKEVAGNLISIASDFQLHYDQLFTLPDLIIACRHRWASVKGSMEFHLFASCMLSLSFMTGLVAFLPPLFDIEQMFLTVFIQLPFLTLGSMFTPFNPKSNVIRIAPKNLASVHRQSISWAVITFIVGFCPTSLFLVLFHFIMLIRNSLLACSFREMVCTVVKDTPHTVLSTTEVRHVNGLHLSVYLCALSSAWVYPLRSFWNDNPYLCPPYVTCCVIILVLQVIFSYASGVQLFNALSIFSLGSLIIWSTVIIVKNELIKQRSIRIFVREQRRTKLGFDTKLGMNSPY